MKGERNGSEVFLRQGGARLHFRGRDCAENLEEGSLTREIKREKKGEDDSTTPDRQRERPPEGK